MKSISSIRIGITALAATFIILLPMLCRADDVSDVKAEFNKYVEYMAADDPKVLDMFKADCVVRFTYLSGADLQARVVATKDFLQTIKDGIAKKEGGHDDYKHISAKQEGADVRVECTMVSGDGSGTVGPFSAVYTHDADGKWRIKELSIMVPAP